MTVKLSVEIISPLTPEDHELLTGVTVLQLSIANRQMAEQRFPDIYSAEAQAAALGETPHEPMMTQRVIPFAREAGLCGLSTVTVCQAPVDHDGPHQFRFDNEWGRLQ